MNQELVQKIIEYLEKSECFILSQAPDFIQQLMNYESLSCIIGMSVCGIIISLAVFISVFSICNPRKDEHGFRTLGSTYLCFMPLIASCMFILPIYNYASMLIKINVAPKVFLLEYMMRYKR